MKEVRHGVSLWEMDKIICPACTLCRDHEKAGFVESVKLGVRLSGEIAEE